MALLSSDSSSNLATTVVSWLLGALGIAAFIKLLPRAISYGIRRWVFGLIMEVIVVVLAGLLTEKLVSRLSPQNGTADTNGVRSARS